MDYLTKKKPFLEKRAFILNCIREFFNSKGYLEVETPILVPSPGTELHIEAFYCEGRYLSPSPEYQMKRLLAAGYNKIYQIAKCFRKGERGELHLPEYTMLEWYQKGYDYFRLMEETEELIIFIAKRLDKYPRLTYQNRTIDLSPPWPRMTMEECFRKYAGKELEERPDEELFYKILINEIEPRLKEEERPIFVYDWPINMASLSRIKKKDEIRRAERVELYIAGLELCNGFTELIDSNEQKQRCLREIELRRKLGKPIYPLDYKFISSLDFIDKVSYGNALGIDRLVMLFTDSEKIDNVVSFTPEEL